MAARRVPHSWLERARTPDKTSLLWSVLPATDQAQKSGSPHRPLKKNFCVLLNEVVFLQGPLWSIPLVDPIDHSQQREGGGTGRDAGFRRSPTLHFGNQVLHKMYIIFLAGIDSLAKRWRQRVIFMQHHGDLPVTFAQDDRNVTPDEHP